MAEVVHRNLELMLPELEELERSGIFSPQEIKEIIRRRRSLEYKLQRRPSRKEDFLRAITYELNLDKLRKIRKKRLGVTSARRDAEYGIQDRVHSLFKRAVKRFKADVKLWLQYIDFCQKSHHYLSLGRVLAKALALHPSRPGLWVMAAKFQFETQNNPSSARSTMQQGLRSNPSSTQLWLEYFRMELMHVDKMRKRRMMLGLEKSEDEDLEKLGEEFFSYKIPSIVFHEAVKAVPGDVEFLAGFVKIYRLFEGTEQRQEEVYSCIKRDHSHTALCWETMAHRHCLSTNLSSMTEAEVVSIEEKMEECYKEGLAVTVEPSLLWGHYLRWCCERVEDDGCLETARLRAIRRLLTAYKNCTDSKHMSEQMFKEQVDVLRRMGLLEEAGKALLAGTKAHSHSHALWLMRLESERSGEGGCKARSSEEDREPAAADKLVQLCSEAVEVVPVEHSLCIWQFWLEVLTSSDSPASHINTIFQRAINSTSQADQEALSLQYIDWSLLTGGIRAARVTYSRFLEKTRVPYSLYLKCIDVEKSQEKPSMKKLRELYDKALSDWGTVSPDLWLDYISAETSLSGGDPARVSQLHWRATKTLSGTHTADFIARYSVLHITQEP